LCPEPRETLPSTNSRKEGLTGQQEMCRKNKYRKLD